MKILILSLTIIFAGNLYSEETTEYLILGNLLSNDPLNGTFVWIKVYTPKTPTEKQAKQIFEDLSEKYQKLLNPTDNPLFRPKIAITLYDSLNVSKLEYRADYFIPREMDPENAKKPQLSYRKEINPRSIDYSQEPPWWKQ